MKFDVICLLLVLLFADSCNYEKGVFVCPPCDLPCDDLTFSEDGYCPHCNMKLITNSSVNKKQKLVLNEINLIEGSGEFLIEGGKSNAEKKIRVYYHKPKSYDANSNILLVIAGAGRNADRYRDAWIDKSEKYNVLILSPMYKQSEYPFEDYHLGGLICNTNLESSIERVQGTNIAKLNEENFSFEYNANEDEWIFNDFDRIFSLVVSGLKSEQKTYDIFGHSAGAHILHRLALFHKTTKADNIIACNPSFYTCPTTEHYFPFGIKDLNLEEGFLAEAFKKKLVVFLGEMDNDKELRGTFLRSKTADKQGLSRLTRGKYFFNRSKEIAGEDEFNWKIKIVPNVGHDHRLMGDAVGQYLYETRIKSD